jgi:hypothetical protein
LTAASISHVVVRFSLISSLFAGGLVRAQSVPADAQNLDPQDLRERWDSYVQRTYSWKRVGVVTAETAFGQTFQLNKCGRPPYCFPHEIGAALTRRTARTTIEFGVGALLHEDLRRRPSNLTGLRRRVSYAMLHAPLAVGPDGEWRPAYSRFAGTFGGTVVTSAWSGRPITAPELFGGFGWSLTSYFQDALWTEFGPDVKRLAHRYTHRLRKPHQAPAVSPGNPVLVIPAGPSVDKPGTSTLIRPTPLTRGIEKAIPDQLR